MSNKRAKEQPQKEPVTEQESGIPVEHSAASEPSEAELALDELKKSLAEAQSQVEEFKSGWQRALADFQNYKRRVDAEREETYQSAVGNIIKRYLPILDDLERALAHRPENLPWADGIELIYRKLQTILENEGLKRIEADGKPFDPNIHEAIAQEQVEGIESGTVIGVVQQGYSIGERVIRPAMVRVAQ